MATWKNWARNVSCSPMTIESPSTVEEIQELVTKANNNGKKIRVVGSGHSFTEVCATDQIMLDISNLSGIDAVDIAKKQITFWAGTSVREAGVLAIKNGMGQENLGDFDLQTLAGATATGTHGTGLKLTGIAKQIVAFWIVTSTGELIECSAEKNKTIFEAGRVSLGTFGIIVKVKLQMVDAYKLKCDTKLVNLPELLPKIPKLLQEHRNLEFFYFPMTDKAICKQMNITNKPVKDSKIKNYINQKIIENTALNLICELTHRFNINAQKINQLMASFVGSDTRINYYNKILATDRNVRFYEMEYNIPTDDFANFFKELSELINAKKYPVFFPIEIRWVQKDDIWLSPTYKRDAVYFAIHTYHKSLVPEYFTDVEQLAMKYQGRPHWGKIHYQNATYLKTVYPKWEEFMKIRKELDPKGTFSNTYIESVFSEKSN